MAYVRDPSGNVGQLTHSEFSPPGNKPAEIIRYFQSNERDIFYAVLNHPAMEVDGVTLQSFSFVLYVPESNGHGGAVAARYYWYYDILLH